MSKTDLVLLHAPSVFDFREKNILYGPISEQTPASEQFEIYPLGFLSMATYLEARGLKVRIVNLAARMILDPSFSPRKLLARLKPSLFGIDLHWLPHAHGALEVARLVKELHPDIPLVMGGLSASYFYEEIMQSFPEVDFILRGDCCEEPVLRLIKGIKEGASGHDDVPNLCWREKGEIRINPIGHVPASLDGLRLDYGQAVRMVSRYRDFKSPLPFSDWPRYNASALFTCHGCSRNCAFCGGSSSAFSGYYGRKKAAFSPPEQLAADLKRTASILKGPIFLLGDLREMGTGAMNAFLEAARRISIKNEVVVEVFQPADDAFFRRINDCFPRYNVEFTPDSHDPAVRRVMNKDFSTEDIEETVRAALDNGCRRFDIFFMSGLSGQSAASVSDTVAYCGELLARFGREGRLHPYLSLLSPFVDPGSLIFENPKKYGYKIMAGSLAEHRRLLLNHSWTDRLNYETRWMDRRRLGDVSLEALAALTKVKARYGLISLKQSESAIRRYANMGELDAKLRGKSEVSSKMAVQIRAANSSSAHERSELEWPGRGVRPIGVLKALIGRG